jgi:DNA-directed RNA polymerase subunit RPC12/RpoP
MKQRVNENREAEYKCGKCGTIVFYSIDSQYPNCPECGWQSKTQSQYDIPKDVKFELHK